jgi:hypothetical protein
MAEILAARVKEGPLRGRILVLKRMLPHLAREPQYVQMFEDEARILRMLDHPNVVRMYETGTLDGSPYIAMEYIEGHDVRAVIVTEAKRGRRIPLQYVLGMMAGAAAGLEYAHERKDADGRPLGIIHRDISPHNVLVTYDGLVKVVDFGIAKAANRANQTRQVMLKGKLPYMSPEQAEGGALDRRADVYALGAVLFELTVGRRPFRGKSDVALLSAILRGPVPQPSALVADYPKELERIVLKALAREADARYPRAEDLRRDLLAFAREAKLDASPGALGEYMQELFADQLAELRRAREEGVDLPTVLVGWAKEGGEDDDEPAAELSGRAAGQPWWVEERRLGSVKVVSLGGRLTELFRGAEVATLLQGTVVLDLGEVERITSFGVREWLRMIDDSQGTLQALYLARCTEAVVNQLRMIRRLSGQGQVVSFFGPYRCLGCGGAFAVLLEGPRHGADIRAGRAPKQHCPRCGYDAAFDDDPRAYFSFATALVDTVPPEVAQALDSIQPATAPVEKAIHGGVTRYRVRAGLDDALKWGRVLEGAEGTIEIDLSRAEAGSGKGAEALVLALSTLGREVTQAQLVSAPVVVLEALAAAKAPAAVKLISARLPSRCTSCGAVREIELQAGARVPPCASCRGALELTVSAGARGLLAPAGGPSPAAPARRSRRPVVAVAGTAAVAALASAALWLLAPPRRPPPMEPPPWAGSGVVDEGTRLLIAAAGEDPSPERALAAAHEQAVAMAGEHLARLAQPSEPTLEACRMAQREPPTAEALAPLLGGAVRDSLAAVDQYWVAPRLHVRYALAGTAAARARQELDQRADLRGMKVAACGPSMVVVAAEPGQPAHRAGLRVGDILLEAGDQTLDSAAALLRADGAAGPELRLTVEAGGARRTIRVPR